MLSLGLSLELCYCDLILCCDATNYRIILQSSANCVNSVILYFSFNYVEFGMSSRLSSLCELELSSIRVCFVLYILILNLGMTLLCCKFFSFALVWYSRYNFALLCCILQLENRCLFGLYGI